MLVSRCLFIDALPPVFREWLLEAVEVEELVVGCVAEGKAPGAFRFLDGGWEAPWDSGLTEKLDMPGIGSRIGLEAIPFDAVDPAVVVKDRRRVLTPEPSFSSTRA